MIIAEGEGYGGPLVVGVRTRRTEDGGRLAEALMLSHKETPAFMERLHRGNFFRQFGGKHVADNFIVDDDIDAVSGATVSARGLTAAIRGSVHLGAVNHLKLEQTWQQPGWIFGRDEAVLVLLFVLAFVAGYRKDKVGKYAAIAVTAGALVFIGFMANASLSLANIAGVFMGYIPSPTPASDVVDHDDRCIWHHRIHGPKYLLPTSLSIHGRPGPGTENQWDKTEDRQPLSEKSENADLFPELGRTDAYFSLRAPGARVL